MYNDLRLFTYYIKWVDNLIKQQKNYFYSPEPLSRSRNCQFLLRNSLLRIVLNISCSAWRRRCPSLRVTLCLTSLQHC